MTARKSFAMRKRAGKATFQAVRAPRVVSRLVTTGRVHPTDSRQRHSSKGVIYKLPSPTSNALIKDNFFLFKNLDVFCPTLVACICMIT